MGNAAASKAALLVLDKPLVTDLEPNEVVHAELSVNDQKVSISSWPARPITVSPPPRGLLSAVFYAVDDDEEEDKRELGRIMVPNQPLEAFQEPAFQLWLGLLDANQVPMGRAAPRDTNSVFELSLATAQRPGKSKVCLTVAAVEPQLLTGRPEDIWHFQNMLAERPVMRLLTQSGEIIRHMHEAQREAESEVSHKSKEFGAKEKLYQGVVREHRSAMQEIQTRMKERHATFSNIKAAMHDHMGTQFMFHEWKVWTVHRKHTLKHSTLFDVIMLRKIFHEWKIQCFHNNSMSAKALASMQALELEIRSLQAEKEALQAELQAVKGSTDSEVKRRRARHDTVVDHTLMHYERDQNLLCLHYALVDWDAAVKQAKLDHLKAMQLAEQQLSQQYYQTKLEAVLFVLGIHTDHIKQILFRTWRDYVEEGKEKAVGIAAEAQLIRKLQQGKMVNISHMLCDSRDTALVFARWHALVTSDKTVRRMRQHLSEQESREDQRLDMMMMQWGGQNNQLMLHSILHQLSKYCKTAKLERERAVALAEQARIEKEHDDRMKYVLLRWEGHTQDFTVQLLFQAWRDYIEDSKQALALSSITAEAERIRVRRETDVRALLFKTVEKDDGMVIHAAFAAWRDDTKDEKAIRGFHKLLEKRKKDHGNLMAKGLVKWGGQVDELVLHTVMRVWNQCIVAENEQLRNARHIAEQQRIREEHDNRMKFVLECLETDNSHFTFRLVFQAWKDAAEDTRIMRKTAGIEGETARLRKLYRLDVSKLIHSGFDKEGTISTTHVFSRWREHIADVRKAKTIDRHRSQLRELKDLHLDKVFFAWDTNDNALSLHSLLHIWVTEAREAKLLRLEAKHIAEQQRIRDLYRDKLLFAITQMEGDNKGFTQQLYFETWRDLIEDSKQAAQLSETMAQAERLRHMHQRDVRKLFFQFVDVDVTLLCHITLAGWREYVADEKGARQYSKHLGTTKDTMYHIIEKTAALLDGDNDVLTLHLVLRTWQDEAHLCKERALRAIHMAKYKAAQEKTDEATKVVLMKWLSNNGHFLMVMMFSEWRDFIEDAKQMAELSKMTEQAWRLKQLQQGPMRSLLHNFVSGEDALEVHTYFACWREHAAAAKRLQAQEQVSTVRDNRRIRCVEKALLLWGSANDGLSVHTILRAWASDVAWEAMAREKAIALEVQQRIQQMRHQHLAFVLLKMDEGNLVLLVDVTFTLWRDTVQESKQAMALSSITAEADHLMKLHQGPVRSMVQRFLSIDDSLTIHHMFVCWRELLRDEKRFDQLNNHIRSMKDLTRSKVDRALLTWGDSNSDMLLHMVMRTWLHYNSEEREFRIQAETGGLKAKCSKRTQLVYNKMDNENQRMLVTFIFDEWLRRIREMRQEEEMSAIAGVASKVERMQSLQRHIVFKFADAMGSLGFETVLTALRAVAAWRDCLIEARQTKSLTVKMRELFSQWRGSNLSVATLWAIAIEARYLTLVLLNWRRVASQRPPPIVPIRAPVEQSPERTPQPLLSTKLHRTFVQSSATTLPRSPSPPSLALGPTHWWRIRIASRPVRHSIGAPTSTVSSMPVSPRSPASPLNSARRLS